MLNKISPLTKVKDDKELLAWMKKNLTYHGVVKNHLFTPEEVIETKKAHCWESTELERRELHYLGYTCKTIMLVMSNLSVTHTALVYVKEGKFYWFEWAWHKHEGIHGPFDSKNEVIKHIGNLFIKDNGRNIYCFYGYMHINKNETAAEYFKRAEQCEEIKVNYLNETDKIRLATVRDLDLIKMYRNGIEPDTPYMGNPTKEKLKERLIECINNEDKAYYIVIRSNEIVGMFIYTIDRLKKILHIDHISISKTMYGTGLSNKLMNMAETQAKKYNIETLELVVHKDNIRGIKFYEKIGYKHIKTVKHILTYRKVIINKKIHSLENW